MTDERPYSPGLEGVIAGETALCLVDGDHGRLLYRGYRIGDLVEHGTYPAVANLLWTGEWDPAHHLPTGPVPEAVITALRALPRTAKPMDALRTAVSVWGASQVLAWPPTPEQARALTAFSPSALAAFARLRQGQPPIEPDPALDLVAGFLYQLTGERPDAGTARALDAYFICGAEHSFNASTFTARVIVSSRSDIASAVTGAIGSLKGPWHGGAPTEVVEQIHQVGSPERAEAWVRETLDRGERLMGFGHRVYRAYDPRAAALRKVAESMAHPPEWLAMAIAVEDVALRVLAERHPERAEAWVRETVASGGRIMGFGHRVYRAYDPRAAALRQVAEAMDPRPDWLDLAIQVEDVVLRVLAELKPRRVLKTNVEYYAAPVLMGVGLTPDLFPATFALARHAGWTAHILEQAGANRIIRPDARYIGPPERDLPT